MALVELEHISVGYGTFTVIHDVSMAIDAGEFVSLIGPNGAGKTTLIGTISGSLLHTSGIVRYQGNDISRWHADRRARAGIGRSFQRTNLFPQLSVLENVKLGVLAKGRIGARQLLRRRSEEAVEAAQAALARVGLTSFADAVASSLSHGDKRKLELAMILSLAPRVILLDEPTAGMSLAEAPVILDLIDDLRQSGDYAILLVEHKLEVVMRLSNRVAVLHQGVLLTEGTPAEVMANPEVERAYLGGRHDSTA